MAVGAETPPPRGDRHPALVGRHARLVQQGFTEALTLAVCAAGLALLIAWAAVRGLVAIAPAGIPRIGNAALDARMFGFPSACPELHYGLAENVLTMRLSLPNTRYDNQRRAALIEQLISNCRALPGVTDAAATSTLPLTGQAEGWGLLAEDNPNREDYTMARVRAVTPEYFRTLGIRVRAGRNFNDSDRGANRVAIVSESAARRLWPGVPEPLGRRLLSKPPMTVVGIVDDTLASGVDAEIRPYLYLPFSQFAPAEFAVAVRSASDPSSLVNAVKAEIWRIDKDQPVTHIAVMKQIVVDSIAPRRFQAILMTLFAAFALVLVAIGIYGVLSYAVAQRTQEIGIRMALGASRWSVVAGVLKQACVLAIAGAAVGLAAAFRLTPLLRSLLFGVSVTEMSIFLGCAVLLVGVAVVASVVLARRASKLDPITCLRYE